MQPSWLAVIDAGVAEGVVPRDLDPKILYRLMRDALWLSVRWFKPTRDYPIARLAEDCTSCSSTACPNPCGRESQAARNVMIVLPGTS